MANSSNPSDRWYFTKEQLEGTPSRKCGFDSHKELSNRQQAANFIQDMGQRLKVSQLCINTAIVYMHRFYVFHSFTHFPWHQMAAAALFLAAKVEEQPRKLEYVIRVANICKTGRDTTIDVTSERYINQSQDLVFNENVLLQTLGFDVAIDHPHTHVVRCCHLVRASKDLAQTSYFMASNSLHLTTMCIQYKPTVVACFCILVACKWSNWEIPLSYEKKEWYSYVDPTVTAELLQQLTEEFLVIFEKCPSRLKEKIMAIADNINHIPSHHINSPFDTEPRKIVKDEKDGHSHRSSSGMEDPHKHRSSRPHEMSGSNQHRERDRNRERLPHQQKPVMGSSSSTSSNSGQIKSSSHSSHHRPPIDPKMKPPSRPIPYPQPKDILREAAARDSPFGLAREFPKDPPHLPRSDKDPHLPRSDKDPNKQREYHMKNNNQNEVNSANNAYGDHRLNYSADKMNYDKQRLDTNGRPRIDPSKPQTAPVRREESKSHLDNIKKHLSAGSHDKNTNYLNKPISHEAPKSVPKPPVVPPPAKVSTNSNSYAPPIGNEVKVKPEPVVVKEEVPTPAVIKRPSLFSPEKTPPHKQSGAGVINESALLSPLISPMQVKRERNYSSSSEPELRPVMKKIDQVEGFENLIRDSTIGINKMGQTPDSVKMKNEIDVTEGHVESNGDSFASSNDIINRPAPINGLETTNAAVISNLLKEVTTVSHLPTVAPTETPVQDQSDKNHFHHKSKKKNKDKHKHKDKNREDKEKKKKHKDKDREKHKHREKSPEPPPVESLKLKIPKGKIIPVEVPPPQIQGLKIKIPKNKINTENISELSQTNSVPPSHPAPMGIKLTIPKDKINNFVNLESGKKRERERDRDRDRGSPDGPPSKMHKSSVKTNGRYSNSNKVDGESSVHRLAESKYIHKTSTS